MAHWSGICRKFKWVSEKVFSLLCTGCTGCTHISQEKMNQFACYEHKIYSNINFKQIHSVIWGKGGWNLNSCIIIKKSLHLDQLLKQRVSEGSWFCVTKRAWRSFSGWTDKAGQMWATDCGEDTGARPMNNVTGSWEQNQEPFKTKIPWHLSHGRKESFWADQQVPG